MPVVENPLLYGGPTRWDKVRTNISARCTRCRMVHPGRYMAELVGGLCTECQQKGANNAKPRLTETPRTVRR